MVAELGVSKETLPKTLAGFRDYHAGATIVVCGCGTSLSTLQNPERFLTIGVNDVGRLFQPDYLVVLNTRSQFTRDRFQHVESSRARAVFTHVNLGIPHPHVVKVLLGKRGGTDFDNPNALAYTRNSPYVAAMLALCMGARRIGLIGVDFTDHHFFANTGRHSLSRDLAQIDAEYRRLHAACEKRGVEFVNLSESSRLTSLPKMSLVEFAAAGRFARRLRIVSYSTSPVAGVPVILGRAIADKTVHSGRTVWASNSYRNGVVFPGDVEYSRAPAEANELLSSADVVVVHNGKVDARHRPLLQEKAVLTLAHNYKWNVSSEFVDRRFPALVVGQYQATLPEFEGWKPVPNPIPWWDPSHQPGRKDGPITIAYTPLGKHERYPAGHSLYWHAKGYRTTHAILERLAGKHRIRLEVIRQHQVSHVESQAMKRRAHIVIDECVTGSYHRNSLEGLAAGAVVVNGVGLLPEIVSVLRDCAGTEEVPFVHASLDSLEQVLEGLIAEGAEALIERGRVGRAWMERHWDFDTQWSRFWEPAIDQALDQVRRQRRAAAPLAPAAQTKAAIAAPPQRVAAAAAAPAVNAVPAPERSISFVTTGNDSIPPNADIVLAKHGEKPRAFNAAFPFARHELVLFVDAGVVLTGEFLARAVEELESRHLDVLIPWTSMTNGTVTQFTRRGGRGGAVLVRKSYLERFGGYLEELSPAAADEAFFAKAKLLAPTAVTQRSDQHLRQTGAPREIQPSDFTVLHQIRILHSRERFLRRFPPPTAFTAPWTSVRRIFVEENAADIASELAQLYGEAVLIVRGDEPRDAVLRRHGDASPREQALQFAAHLATGQAGAKLKLNLGCFDRPVAGFLNFDKEVDLTARWPWSDGEADLIRAWDVIEHLPDKIHTMNEIWRVLRKGGHADINVPTTDGSGAYQDPTHVSFWNRRSFLYYEHGSPYRERFAERYGIRAKFRVVSEETRKTQDGPSLHIVLEAVK